MPNIILSNPSLPAPTLLPSSKPLARLPIPSHSPNPPPPNHPQRKRQRINQAPNRTAPPVSYRHSVGTGEIYALGSSTNTSTKHHSKTATVDLDDSNQLNPFTRRPAQPIQPLPSRLIPVKNKAKKQTGRGRGPTTLLRLTKICPMLIPSSFSPRTWG